MKPTPRGLWRRVPPAVFPSVLGLLGVGLGWRQAVALGVPPGVAETYLGAVALLAVFALVALAGKISRRPAVALEDLRILPGRAGFGAAVLSIYALAIALAPYGGGRAVLAAGMAVHLVLTVLVVSALVTGPAEQRRINPTWHLMFTGWIFCALAAQAVGLPRLSVVLFWPSLAIAVLVWLVSVNQFAQARVPAPLRPLLCVHLAPMAIFGTVALGLGATGIATSFAVLGALYLAVLAVSVRWLTAAGFSPLWGSFTFPLAATAGFWIALGWQVVGGCVLVAATLVTLPVAFRILKSWAAGQLAVKTGAAIA